MQLEDPSHAATGTHSRVRYDSLTLWRGLACLLVVVYHSARSPLQETSGATAVIFAILGKCWIGVPLFFVISGYCVIASADALRAESGAAKRFFWRRFRRIYPPYWAALAMTALFAWLTEKFLPEAYFQSLGVPPPQSLTGWQWLGNFSLTETWRWHLTGGSENPLLPPSWTLCFEEQFYFLTGLALAATRRFLFHALTLVTLIVTFLVLFPLRTLRTEGLFLDGQWLMFASGVLVYHVSNDVPTRTKAWCCLPLVAGIMWAVPDLRELRLPSNQGYLAAFSFALLIIGLKRWDAVAYGLRMLSPLRSLGLMCYSLYLVHWPVVRLVGHAVDSSGADTPMGILLLRIPCCVGMTILLGSWFHRFIERRFWNPGFSQSATETSRVV